MYIYECTVSTNLRSYVKFWHVPYEGHARVTHVLAGRGCDGRRSAMKKSRLCAPRAPGQVYLVLSFILLYVSLQGDFRSRHRRCVHRAATAPRRAIRDDVTQSPPDWPCANLTYHSLTHSNYSILLFSSLAETLPERKEDMRR